MKLHNFIFGEGTYRLYRHLAFWLAWMLFSSVVQLTNFQTGSFSFGDLAVYQVLRTLTRLPSPLLFCYVTVYFLVPKFIIPKKYKAFVISMTLFVVILYFFNYFLLTPLYDFPAEVVGGDFSIMRKMSPFIKKFFAFYSNINFTGAVPACCLMLAVKYYKDWYAKQKQSEMLLVENTQAELQLLRAQVHPHFLFNTLNNIYSFALTRQPRAADLVDQLAGMIDYMRKEGAQGLVPLEREIQLVRDYIGLEKIRYGDRLDLQLEIAGSAEGKMIVPLLMIPFVENSFKHGSSKTRGRQWIRLTIEVNEDQLLFNLSNSATNIVVTPDQKSGIGLKNVKKRLELLYPGKHRLQIELTAELFSVHMELQLDSSVESKKVAEFSGDQPLVYAQ